MMCLGLPGLPATFCGKLCLCAAWDPVFVRSWWSAVRRPSKDVPCGNLFARPHTIQPSTLLCVKNLYFVGKDPGTAACMSCSIWITAPPHSIQLKSFQAVQLNASEPFLFSETFARILLPDQLIASPAGQYGFPAVVGPSSGGRLPPRARKHGS